MRRAWEWPLLGGVLLAIGMQAVGAWAAEPRVDPLHQERDYATMLALSGRHAAAESVFVSLLSHARGDAGALNGLGNLRLLSGEVDLALVFYGRAHEADTTDAGIVLNQATT